MHKDPLFFIDEVRSWLRKYNNEEISLSKFVELFNDKVYEKYAASLQPSGGLRWVKASVKRVGDQRPAGKEKQVLSIKYKGTPSALIFLNGNWCWYEVTLNGGEMEGRGIYYKVHAESWSVIEYLAETPSDVEYQAEWEFVTILKENFEAAKAGDGSEWKGYNCQSAVVETYEDLFEIIKNIPVKRSQGDQKVIDYVNKLTTPSDVSIEEAGFWVNVKNGKPNCNSGDYIYQLVYGCKFGDFQKDSQGHYMIACWNGNFWEDGYGKDIESNPDMWFITHWKKLSNKPLAGHAHQSPSVQGLVEAAEAILCIDKVEGSDLTKLQVCKSIATNALKQFTSNVK